MRLAAARSSSLHLEGSPQFLARRMQPPLRGPLRDAEHGGDFGDRSTLDVMEDQDRPAIGVEAGEGPPDNLNLGDALADPATRPWRVGGASRIVDRDLADGRPAPPAERGPAG